MGAVIPTAAAAATTTIFSNGEIKGRNDIEDYEF